MSSNINTFLVRLDLYRGETVPAVIQQRVRAVAMEATRGVVEATPVDTGRLKGNWQPSIGAPAVGTVDRTDATPMGSAAASPAVAEAMALMLGWRMGDWFWLHNGLPYAVHQEHGTARMAGRHMVGRTVARLEAAFGS